MWQRDTYQRISTTCRQTQVTTVSCDNGKLVDLCRESLPDIVLIDVLEPEIDVIEQIKALAPATKIILLVGHSNPNDVLQCIAAGVSGYLCRSEPIEEMVPAIKAAIGGKVVIDPKIAIAVAERYAYTLPKLNEAVGHESLTRRELEILRLVAAGYRDKQIALGLRLSPRTVKSHIANALSKMAVHSRSHAVAAAVKQKII